VTELAYLLGFEDSNSFYRSFRRWTGTTPESYRRAVNE
jgi:AraC-like DNA-binding protein